MSETKVVWHVGAWSNNFGDRALQVGNTKILREHYDGHVQFIYVDTQKTYFGEELIEKMNREADLLLIGGGGLLFYRPMDNSHSGWQFNISNRNWDEIKIPIVVYGIGYNKFPHNDHDFFSSAFVSLAKIIYSAKLFSVRNEGTFSAMKEAGLSMDRVSIVPDAGMFIDPDPYKLQPLSFPENKIKIGVNWATDRPEQRFGSYENYRTMMKRMLLVCKDISSKYGADIYIIEHLMPNDLCSRAKEDLHSMAKEVCDNKNLCILRADRPHDEKLYPPFDYTVGFLADIYRQMDIVFGMRGHANIIPFGQNTPFVGIGKHNKVKWFLEEIGLPENFINLSDEYYLENAICLASDIIENPAKYKKQMAAAHKMMSRTKDVFMKQVAEILRGV